MKSKDKLKKNIKFTFKKAIFLCVCLTSIIYIMMLCNRYFGKNNVYAKEFSDGFEKLKISNANPIDIEEIISEDSKTKDKVEYVIEEVNLEYITKYQENNLISKGTIQVVQEGRQGKQQITKKRVYQNEELISEEQVSCKVTKAAINKIVEVGTAKYKSNYKVKVGDNVYVTSDRLSIMTEPNEESKKMTTVFKEKELKILEITGDWYKISASGTTGYVKAECTTYVSPESNSKEEVDSETSKSKAQLVANLNYNMQLNKPSGLSLEQFKKILSDDKDTNKVFQNNAQYFYYIEKQYNINGVFVASVGIHESAWGTSKISKNKNNLFGYGAYDSNPYNGAYNFSDYSESIDLIARVFTKYYLNPAGTKIYGGEIAEGTYYNGPTIAGVNTKYATDKNWSNGVYNYMKYLYNKL